MEHNQRKYKYHFTSCTSLHGMLKDYSMNNPYLTMWATHSSFMNDSSEYEYGRNKCMEVLRLYEKKANIPPEKSIFKRSRKQLEEFMTKDAPFLISLSSNIESAAMWGMYSSNGNGIALEFDATILRKEGLANEVELSELKDLFRLYNIQYVNDIILASLELIYTILRIFLLAKLDKEN